MVATSLVPHAVPRPIRLPARRAPRLRPLDRPPRPRVERARAGTERLACDTAGLASGPRLRGVPAGPAPLHHSPALTAIGVIALVALAAVPVLHARRGE